MDAKEQRLLYRAAEVAQITGFSKQGIYQLSAEGRIPCVRIGRAVRFPAEALQAWVRELAEQQQRV
jgi:excisionase family DNA binding protein